MSERKKGHYHIEMAGGTYEVAEWDGEGWLVCGFDQHVDFTFDSIGHRIPSPDEDWVCVPKNMTESMRSALTVGSATDAPTKEPTKFWDDAYSRMLSKATFPDYEP